MLEPHLAGKNHQEEANLQHPEPPAHTQLLHAMLHWETRRAPMPPYISSKPAWEMQTNKWTNKQHAVLPQPTPGINQHSPPDRLSPAPQKKNLNNKQGTEKDMQQREQDAFSTREKWGGARSWAPHDLSVSRACNSRQLTVGGRWTTVWNSADSSSQVYLLSQPLGETTTELLFKYQYQDWMQKE
jgi:hypothetical protein